MSNMGREKQKRKRVIGIEYLKYGRKRKEHRNAEERKQQNIGRRQKRPRERERKHKKKIDKQIETDPQDWKSIEKEKKS